MIAGYNGNVITKEVDMSNYTHGLPFRCVPSKENREFFNYVVKESYGLKEIAVFVMAYKKARKSGRTIDSSMEAADSAWRWYGLTRFLGYHDYDHHVWYHRCRWFRAQNVRY